VPDSRVPDFTVPSGRVTDGPAGRFGACLVDAYNTLVYTDYAAHRDELPALAGLPADVLYGEFRRLGPALGTGRITLAEAFARILRAGGAEPRPGLVRALTARTRELLLSTARLYDDALPFLRELRSRGVKVAIVSNCDENTRPLLAACGVAALADALILSCEVGAEKPEAAIYRRALDRLGVPAGSALFVDDNAAFCAGAGELGITALRIVRGSAAGHEPGAAVVTSLAEVGEMFGARKARD
jgi:putative hydrolase of the HAD superfamily